RTDIVRSPARTASGTRFGTLATPFQAVVIGSDRHRWHRRPPAGSSAPGPRRPEPGPSVGWTDEAQGERSERERGGVAGREPCSRPEAAGARAVGRLD